MKSWTIDVGIPGYGTDLHVRWDIGEYTDAVRDLARLLLPNERFPS
jgi:hypothetical protein